MGKIVEFLRGGTSEEIEDKIKKSEQKKLEKQQREQDIQNTRYLAPETIKYAPISEKMFGRGYVEPNPESSPEEIKAAYQKLESGYVDLTGSIKQKLTDINEARKVREIRIKGERLEQSKQAQKMRIRYQNLLQEAQMKAQIQQALARQYAPRPVRRRPSEDMNAMTRDTGFISGASPFDSNMSNPFAARDPFNGRNPFMGRGKKRNFLNDPNPFGL